MDVKPEVISHDYLKWLEMLSYLTESLVNSELSRVCEDERLGVEFDLRAHETQQIVTFKLIF